MENFFLFASFVSTEIICQGSIWILCVYFLAFAYAIFLEARRYRAGYDIISHNAMTHKLLSLRIMRNSFFFKIEHSWLQMGDRSSRCDPLSLVILCTFPLLVVPGARALAAAISILISWLMTSI